MNRLKNEKSPYLLQHQHNPVYWYAWGEEAFRQAQKEGKLIFLSIGYSTCHWCHVMERESFEHQNVADVLNRDFISIKVDREERPDVDHLYMQAVVGMQGHGGWPLSVFLTPDLKPFFGGTYFSQQQFLKILDVLSHSWREEREKVLISGDRVTEFLNNSLRPEEAAMDIKQELYQAYKQLAQNFDEQHGGFGPAPKFPRSMAIRLLLRLYRRSGRADTLRFAETTLEKMACGGIYDHLGGGFARYATDAAWQVPHFEKMLYDNALLAVTYLEAYQVTRREIFAQVAKETLDYVLRQMTDKNGGFYSAEDADSEGVEGKFYVWQETELKQILNDEELEQLTKVFAISADGNFEDKTNILALDSIEHWQWRQDPQIKAFLQKLFVAREKRTRPHLDDKILTAWNGLMIDAMVKGYEVLEDQRYLDAAINCASFIRDHLYKDGKLLRRYRDGEASISANVNDYAFFIQGLLALFEVTAEADWFALAQELQVLQDQYFWDENDGGYFFSSSEVADLIIRPKDFDDNAIPSGNSIAALNLQRFHQITLDDSYSQKTRRLLFAAAPYVERYPSGYCALLSALDFQDDRSKTIVVHKDNPQLAMLYKYLHSHFMPNKVVVVADANGKQLPIVATRQSLKGDEVYVCEAGSCQLPSKDQPEWEQQIDSYKPLDFSKLT